MSIRPFDEMDRMMEQMRRSMFDVVPDRRGARSNANLSVEQDGDAYVVLADLPGFEKSEIDLRLDGDTLVLDAIQDVEETGEHDTMARSRRVHELVRIPGDIDEDGIEATYRNGVLEIHVPVEEMEDEDDAHRIDIE